MEFNNILINGCPLCDIFSYPKDNIKTKLYYPDSIYDVNKSDFIIIECNTCHEPMCVIRDHIDYINQDIWRNSTYQCRRIFGKNIRFVTKMKHIHDHAHYHILKKGY